MMFLSAVIQTKSFTAILSSDAFCYSVQDGSKFLCAGVKFEIVTIKAQAGELAAVLSHVAGFSLLIVIRSYIFCLCFVVFVSFIFVDVVFVVVSPMREICVALDAAIYFSVKFF